MLDAGGGTVTAVTYEYGNCFLIVSGLLNFLVILDVYDIGPGRKVTSHFLLLVVFSLSSCRSFSRVLLRDEPRTAVPHRRDDVRRIHCHGDRPRLADVSRFRCDALAAASVLHLPGGSGDRSCSRWRSSSPRPRSRT